MNELFLKIINMSISASWLILAVLILRLVLKKAPKWVNVLLWGIVAVRLICPLSFESALSLIPSSETIPLDIEMAAKPTIDSGVPAINRVHRKDTKKLPAEFLPRARCWLAIKRFVFSYSFQIGFGITVQYQISISNRIIVDQIVQF